MIFGLAIVFLILIVVILKTFIIVPEKRAYVKERLGNYAGTLEAGFHFLIPIVDRIAYKHTLKEEVIDVNPQICITKDNVQVEVDGILYIKVVDAEKASYGIDDYRFASMQLAQTNMRSEIGKLELDWTFMEREKINDNVIRAVDEASDPWGIKVTRYEIKNIMPPNSVIHTMEQQMRAEREKRAEIAESEGERAAVINVSEGERQQAINISEGQKVKRINEAEGTAMQIELVADATAEAIRIVADAINQPGGNDAVKLRVAEEYIKQFGHVIQKSKTSVVPVGLANIQGTFEGLGELIGGLKKNQ